MSCYTHSKRLVLLLGVLGVGLSSASSKEALSTGDTVRLRLRLRRRRRLRRHRRRLLRRRLLRRRPRILRRRPRKIPLILLPVKQT